MIRVVLDTNIIASATITKGGKPYHILSAFLENKIEIILSDRILEEIRRVLYYDRIKAKRWMNDDKVEELIANFKESCVPTPDVLNLSVVKEDPTDDKFIIAAVEGVADYIVTGNDHLLNLREYQGIKIITPASFLEILKKG